MSHYRLAGITVLVAVLGIPAKGGSGREVITTGRIALTIRDAGIPVSASQITLPAEIVAKTREPALKVVSVGAWAANPSRVRLACVISEECLPFVVTVHRGQSDRPDGSSLPASAKPPKSPSVEYARSKVILRIGSPAVLLLEGGHVHIELTVVCLENGAVGQTIRVAGREHGPTYLAEVCSDGFLRATL